MNIRIKVFISKLQCRLQPRYILMNRMITNVKSPPFNFHRKVSLTRQICVKSDNDSVASGVKFSAFQLTVDIKRIHSMDIGIEIYIKKIVNFGMRHLSQCSFGHGKKKACIVVKNQNQDICFVWSCNLNIIFNHNLYIFPLISTRDIFTINELTLILKVIGQCDVEAIMALPIKTITSVLEDSTNIATSIILLPVGLAVILVIMSVSTFIIGVIL